MAEGTQTQNRQLYDDSALFHITDDYRETTSDEYHDFQLFVYCSGGYAKIKIADREYFISDHTGLLVMNNNVLTWLEVSPDFTMKAIFIHGIYLTVDEPDIMSYNFRMSALIESPVVKMTDRDLAFFLETIECIRERLPIHDHMFYRPVLHNLVHIMMYDFYDIHSRQNQAGNSIVYSGRQSMRYFHDFITMLENGSYKSEREVRWYAAKLGITAKYLSEISLDTSGHTASYWINKFTMAEITRLLRNPTLSIKSVGEIMKFKTRSYFSHYVKEHLGLTPMKYRAQTIGKKD